MPGQIDIDEVESDVDIPETDLVYGPIDDPCVETPEGLWGKIIYWL